MKTELKLGLPPVANRGARIVILGSFPSPLALDLNQYYPNPRNQFWIILSRILHFPAELSYPARCEEIKRRGVALWDVLHSCTREGAEDKSIGNPVPNQLEDFLKRHRCIGEVFLNGRYAERMYRRHRAEGMPPGKYLPSTSGANAAKSVDQKVAEWAVIKRFL